MGIFEEDSGLKKVSPIERQHWLIPATIFGGLEFAVPVIMVGATLAGSFAFSKILLILFIGLIVIQWIGNGLQGYIGAKTGLSSSVIARAGFGSFQARFIVGLSLVVLNVGWFGLNTAVAGNAISVVLGIDYTQHWLAWGTLTILMGVIFALPAVMGYNSMKWTDYVAVPAGLLLIISAVIFSLRDTGFEAIISWNPEPSMTIWAGISLVLGANVAQWLIASDYTRYSHPTIKDQALIPLGIVVIGFVFFMTGSIMSVGIGESDIVLVMQRLGFPFWGFLILWLAIWTSQIVSSYSTGLAAANMFNVTSGRGRAILTLLGSLLGIALALVGILDHFTKFLEILGIIYPAIAGVMFADFFLVRKQSWEDHEGWNWMATVAMIIGILIGYFTQYIVPFGIPAVQSIIMTVIVYYVGMKIKVKVNPNQFTYMEETISSEINSVHK